MMSRTVYVQYGGSYSGPAPQEFLNFDASPTLRLERLPLIGHFINKNPKRFPVNVAYGDITVGPLVQPGTAKGVFCSHVLEHLSKNDCHRALINSFLMLKPGGFFRFVLPDLKVITKNYIAGYIDANQFMNESGLGLIERQRGIRGLAKTVLGNSQHLWLWDEQSIVVALREAGFSSIRRASFGDSVDPMFNLVETEGRWKSALGIECIKTLC